MSMTKKDYEIIAEVIRAHREEIANDDGWGWSDVDKNAADIAFNGLVRKLADELSIQGGYTANGNRRFNKDKFTRACQGVSK